MVDDVVFASVLDLTFSFLLESKMQQLLCVLDYEDNLTKIHIRPTIRPQMQTRQKSDAFYVDNKITHWRENIERDDF